MDNNSGTYSPNPKFFPLLEKVFHANFPDLEIETVDRSDPKL